MAKQVTQAAANATDRSLVLLAQADVAIVSSVLEPTRTVAARLASIAADADSSGLKSLSVECAVRRVEMLPGLGGDAEALREADLVIARADGLGLKVPLARAHYVKASALRAKGNPDARREYEAALRVFEEIKRDAGNENVVKRADLAPLFTESAKGAQAR